MKIFNKQLGISTALILGIVMLFLPASDSSKYKFDPVSLSDLILNGEDQISPETLSEWIVEEKKDYRLIDIRTEDEFNSGSIKTAENIPLNNLLKKETLDDLEESQKTLILYSNGTSHASQVWLILNSVGLDSYILEGGLNYWNRVILNPNPPANEASDDEILKFKAKSAIAGYLGGGTGLSSAANSSQPKKKKKFKKRPKKKKKKLEGC